MIELAGQRTDGKERESGSVLVKFFNNPQTNTLYTVALEANGVTVTYRALSTYVNKDAVPFRVRVEAEDIGGPYEPVPERWSSLGYSRGETGEQRHVSQIVHGEAALNELLLKTASVIVAASQKSTFSDVDTEDEIISFFS